MKCSREQKGVGENYVSRKRQSVVAGHHAADLRRHRLLGQSPHWAGFGSPHGGHEDPGKRDRLVSLGSLLKADGRKEKMGNQNLKGRKQARGQVNICSIALLIQPNSAFERDAPKAARPSI